LTKFSGRSARLRSIRLRSLIFAMLFAFAFTGYVQRTNVSIAAERMVPELGLTQVQIGWLFTAFLFAYSVLQIPLALFGQKCQHGRSVDPECTQCVVERRWRSPSRHASIVMGCSK
jgi:sugar phosphate permease